MAAAPRGPLLLTAQHEMRLCKLTEHASALSRLILLLDAPHVGFHYSQSLRDAARACLQALARLPAVFAHIQESRQMPTPFVWNQTLRLRDVPQGPATHLLIRWERWVGQIREAREEIKGLSLQARRECDDGDEGGPRPAEAEAAMVREIGDLIRIARSIFRKTKVRCISRLSDQATPTLILSIDRLYRLGASIAVVVDDLIAHLMSPQCPLMVTIIATQLIGRCEELLEAVVEVGGSKKLGNESGSWIDMFRQDLNVSLYRIHERNPAR